VLIFSSRSYTIDEVEDPPFASDIPEVINPLFVTCPPHRFKVEDLLSFFFFLWKPTSTSIERELFVLEFYLFEYGFAFLFPSDSLSYSAWL